MDIGKRTALIIFALVVIMAMVYSSRGGSTSGTAGSEGQTATQPEKAVGRLGGEDGSKYDPKTIYHEELPYRVEGNVIDLSTVDAPVDIGARAFKLRQVDGAYPLKVATISTSRCMIGDLDIISAEMKAHPGAELLLSVEPVTTSFSRFQPIVQKTSVGKLRGGSTLTFLLPPSPQPVHLALFICKDSDGSGRCQSKEVKDLNQVIDPYFGKNPPNAKNPPSDKIFFFHYFLLEGSSLTSFDSELENKAYDRLSEYILSRTQNGLQATEVASRVKFLNDKIRSANVDFSRNRVVIDLPRDDQGKCSGSSVPVPPDLLNELNAAKRLPDKKPKEDAEETVDQTEEPPAEEPTAEEPAATDAL